MKTLLLLWSVVLGAAGLAGAQTHSFLAPLTRLGRPAAHADATQTQAQPKLALALPAHGLTMGPSASATNAQPKQPEKSLQAEPRRPFIEGLPDLAFYGPKANQITWNGHTFSGILPQLVKARNPLELLSPAAGPQYGSGFDNVEWFPFAGTGPVLRLFSFDF